jgi:hypothetical protein
MAPQTRTPALEHSPADPVWSASLARVAQLELSQEMLDRLDRFSRREEIDLPPHVVARKVLEAFLGLAGD